MKLICFRIDEEDLEQVRNKVEKSSLLNSTADYLRLLVIKDLRLEDIDIDSLFLMLNAKEIQRKREEFSKKYDKNDEKVEA